MARGFVFILVIALWCLAIVLFRNLKMDFFKFFVGSIGFFTIAMVFFMGPLEKMLVDSLTYILDLISKNTEWFEVLRTYGIMMIEPKGGGVISMSINYQCSGVIELLVYTALVIFFPFVTIGKKIIVLIVGNLYLVVANIIRILFIVFMVKTFGKEAFDVSHLVIARILFFVLTIILYYKVFTKSQLSKQKVGEIK
ncbi:exosortase family protein XrtG [Clostridium paraputrificum]|uniref:exosortase family protein XrtG n=1 Tax=Clostridium TaxID=1485 RepID=UPI003D332777